MTVIAKAEPNVPVESDMPSRDWTATTTYSLGFLTLISAFNYLDRSLLGLALPAIKAEMGVSDTALGLVSALATTVIPVPPWLEPRPASHRDFAEAHIRNRCEERNRPGRAAVRP